MNQDFIIPFEQNFDDNSIKRSMRVDEEVKYGENGVKVHEGASIN